MSESWKQESHVLWDSLLSIQSLGLTCQRYPFKTHRCRTISTIHFPLKFSIIEIEKPVVWVQFLLATVNHPLMGGFFTLRCHYMSHPCAQGLKVLRDSSIHGGWWPGWLETGPSRATREMLAVEVWAFQEEISSVFPASPASWATKWTKSKTKSRWGGKGGTAFHCSEEERLAFWLIWFLLRIFAVSPVWAIQD